MDGGYCTLGVVPGSLYKRRKLTRRKGSILGPSRIIIAPQRMIATVFSSMLLLALIMPFIHPRGVILP